MTFDTALTEELKNKGKNNLRVLHNFSQDVGTGSSDLTSA
jgi:hypothetical protein